MERAEVVFQYLLFPTILYVLFLAALLGTVIITLILYYHWSRYAMGVISVFEVVVLYSFGAVVFLASMFFALLEL